MRIHLWAREPLIARKGTAAYARRNHDLRGAGPRERQQLPFETHAPRRAGDMKGDRCLAAFGDSDTREHMIMQELRDIEKLKAPASSSL